MPLVRGSTCRQTFQSCLLIIHTSPAITPWIALVSCDGNSTDASQTNDIFTLARDRGAVAGVRSAAVLYDPLWLTVLI